jgi:hypothetical protein
MKRVFTKYEEREIFHSKDPDRLLWVMWAAKEASYKVISKLHPGAHSIPRRYEVYLESDDESPEKSGFVLSPFNVVPVRVSVCNEYIHCMGISGEGKEWDSVVWKVEKMDIEGLSVPGGESRLVREMLRRDLSEVLQANIGDMEILRKKGPGGFDPPRVYVKGRESAVDISMSHDGSFMAYSFLSG